ncbi:drug/metabolite transporter (DMT)-like permease [Rhizobium skierniewicense]|uniref:Drug/metabolite transporter (DMT)-like permease n=1 Tax=Rhizobium skierniewicense TaxID=984260 RepID=A0A7W6G4D8_9HYPH|nr:DMT family transporter [Rhizobium skierniewicense]MBB3948529.1 drug/metabolite transporter (DMT)-like permease [Rhizobium skierniewicense]
MQKGFLLGLLAYASFSCGDATIKSLGSHVSVFEIGFFSILSSASLIFFLKPKDERWRYFWRMSRPWAVHGRAISGLFAGILGIYAFTSVPLAEAYALIFLSPLFVTILSALVLKEDIGLWRWSAVMAGIVGVILVVRPGFKTLELGHFAALCVAFLAGLTIVLLRSLAGREKRTSIMGVLIIYGLTFNGILMIPEFQVPTLNQIGAFIVIGMCTAIGQITLLTATKIAPASQIAPSHYSQILWAVAIGASFFGEYPDTLAISGLVVIASAGLLTMMREKIRLGVVRWNPFFRNRL